MKTKIAAVLLAALTIGTVAVSTTSQAEAHHYGWGLGGFGLGLALGAAAASNYYAPSCYWQPQYDRFGNYLGRVKVCNY